MKNIGDQHGVATPSLMEEYTRAHLPRLTVQSDGTVLVSTQDDLDQLSACPAHDLSTEMLIFVDREWSERSEEKRPSIAAFLNSARQLVCTEGRLPAPHKELPAIGTRVEVLHGGKPNPRRRWAVGTVTSHEWCSVSREWRVGVTFDRSNGTWYGIPIQGVSTFTELVHVIGSPGRAWSSMTLDEIDALLGARRRRRD